MEKPKISGTSFQTRQTLKDLPKKDGEHIFDDEINSDIFKNFFSTLAKELVNRLQIHPVNLEQRVSKSITST